MAELFENNDAEKDFVESSDNAEKASTNDETREGLREKSRWFVVHTYSGYENKVKTDIEKTIENRKDLQDYIFEVLVPVQEVEETTATGKKKIIARKLFPGYVLINMVKNDVTWYVVRNTRGVTGFVGPGSEPVPLTEAEMKKLGVSNDVKPVVNVDIKVGDIIKVVSGAWANETTTRVVTDVNVKKLTVTIDVELFAGMTTAVEVNFSDVKKV